MKPRNLTDQINKLKVFVNKNNIHEVQFVREGTNQLNSLNITTDALSVYGVNFLDRIEVKSSRYNGRATIIGVAKIDGVPQLWYLCDNKIGVSYDARIKDKKSFNLNRYKILPPSAESQSTNPVLEIQECIPLEKVVAERNAVITQQKNKLKTLQFAPNDDSTKWVCTIMPTLRIDIPDGLQADVKHWKRLDKTLQSFEKILQVHQFHLAYLNDLAEEARIDSAYEIAKEIYEDKTVKLGDQIKEIKNLVEQLGISQLECQTLERTTVLIDFSHTELSKYEDASGKKIQFLDRIDTDSTTAQATIFGVAKRTEASARLFILSDHDKGLSCDYKGIHLRQADKDKEYSYQPFLASIIKKLKYIVKTGIEKREEKLLDLKFQCSSTIPGLWVNKINDKEYNFLLDEQTNFKQFDQDLLDYQLKEFNARQPASNSKKEKSALNKQPNLVEQDQNPNINRTNKKAKNLSNFLFWKNQTSNSNKNTANDNDSYMPGL